MVNDVKHYKESSENEDLRLSAGLPRAGVTAQQCEQTPGCTLPGAAQWAGLVLQSRRPPGHMSGLRVRSPIWVCARSN